VLAGITTVLCLAGCAVLPGSEVDPPALVSEAAVEAAVEATVTVLLDRQMVSQLPEVDQAGVNAV
jgi:hypothetical protein